MTLAAGVVPTVMLGFATKLVEHVWPPLGAFVWSVAVAVYEVIEDPPGDGAVQETFADVLAAVTMGAAGDVGGAGVAPATDATAREVNNDATAMATATVRGSDGGVVMGFLIGRTVAVYGLWCHNLLIRGV